MATISTSLAVPLRQLLLEGDGRQFPLHFTIPSYQREFAWTTSNMEDFLNDLNDVAISAKSSAKKSISHFFGPIYYHNLPKTTQLAVLDGQQRLTAIQICVAVLLDITNWEIARLEKDINDSPTNDEKQALEDEKKKLDALVRQFTAILWKQTGKKRLLRLEAEFEKDFVEGMLDQDPGDLYTFAVSVEKNVKGAADQKYLTYAKAVTCTYKYLFEKLHPKGDAWSELIRALNASGDEADKKKLKNEEALWKDSNYESEKKLVAGKPRTIKEFRARPLERLAIEELEAFTDALLAASVLAVNVNASLSWHKLFATLNSRGRPLDPHEKIRNEIFAAVSLLDDPNAEEEMKKKWQVILARFRWQKVISLDRLIYFYLTSHYPEYKTLEQVEMLNAAATIIGQNYETFVDDLDVISARVERVLRKSDETADDNIREYLEDSYTGITALAYEYSFYPIVATAKLEPGLELLRIVETAENFSFRFKFVHDKDQAQFTRFLKSWSHSLHAELESALGASDLTTFRAHVDDFRSACLAHVPDKRFQASFESGGVRPTTSSMQFYILNKLYRTEHDARYKPLKAPEQEVEHIFPRNPKGRYQEIEKYLVELENPNHKKHFLFENYEDQIGNLCLLEYDINRSFKSRKFSEKVRADVYVRTTKKGAAGSKKWRDYGESTSKQVHQIVALVTQGARGRRPAVWKPRDIATRNRHYGSFACQTWSLSPIGW